MNLFRSEEPFGSGQKDIIDVCVYETYDLGNTDILDYITEKYLFGDLKEEALNFLAEYDENGFVDDMGEDDWREWFQKAIDQINIVTGRKLYYCIWLADKERVISYYCLGLQDFWLDEYEISDVVLSDLGDDGQLYAYEALPNPLSSILYDNEVLL